MRITDVKIRKLGEDLLKAVASITIEDCFVVHDIKIISTEKGLIVSMPNKKGSDGKYRDIAHPINKKARKLIEKAVIRQFEQLLVADTMQEVATSEEK